MSHARCRAGKPWPAAMVAVVLVSLGAGASARALAATPPLTTDRPETRAHVLFDDTTGPPRPGIRPGGRAGSLQQPGSPAAGAPRRPAAAAGAPPRPEVLGFAQSGEVSGGAWRTDLRLDLLSTVAYFGINVAADGSLVSSDAGFQGWQSAQATDLINAAHAAGDRLVPTFKAFDNATIAGIVGTEANRQNCIAGIINQLSSRGGDGVNVDFEGYDASVAPSFTTFVGELQGALHSRIPQSSYLTVDTYGSSAQGGTMYDVAKLSGYVDAFDVMAYDLTSTGATSAGPVAPLNGWQYTDNSIVNDYLRLVPPSKVILGVPYYGYKWSTTGNGPQAPTRGPATASTYSQTLSDFTCVAQLSKHFDPTFYEPWATWYSPSSGSQCGANYGSWRELYYEDAQGLGAKYDLVNDRALRGVGIWALGYDSGHHELWDEISNKLTGPPSAFHDAASTQQYTLSGSDGSTWVPIDPANLSRTVAATGSATALVGANVDLFTNTAGVNQDVGIFVSDNGTADQLVAWKESGGFAGTYSPNAAFVQATYPLAGGHTYTFSLRWKTNVAQRPGAIIFAGAGGSAPFSPTRLTTEVQPVAANLHSVVSTRQYSLSGSDGASWVTMDAANLSSSVTAAGDSLALVSGNVDLFTSAAGYNQDVGIFVSDNAGADQQVAWKESGGFAGTYSPNAAMTQAAFSVRGGHSYTFKLKWKTNVAQRPGVTIYAGAGGAAPFSPTRLTVSLPPAGGNLISATSTQQYQLMGSDGSTWAAMDPNVLGTTTTPPTDATALVSANVDLFTAAAGFNQNAAIFVSDNGSADQLVAWKESGGQVGTYSPNAAFVQATRSLTGGHTYQFKLRWKTNIAERSGAAIYAGAGGSAPFSPTGLIVEVG